MKRGHSGIPFHDYRRRPDFFCLGAFGYNIHSDEISPDEYDYQYAPTFGEVTMIDVMWNPNNNPYPSDEWRKGNAYVYGCGTPNYPVPAITKCSLCGLTGGEHYHACTVNRY